MAPTKHTHTHRYLEQDVTETIRFVFDKLGGSDQQLLQEVFSGQLHEMTQCKECGNVKFGRKPLHFTKPCSTSAYSQGSQRDRLHAHNSKALRGANLRSWMLNAL